MGRPREPRPAYLEQLRQGLAALLAALLQALASPAIAPAGCEVGTWAGGQQPAPAGVEERGAAEHWRRHAIGSLIDSEGYLVTKRRDLWHLGALAQVS